MTAVAVFDHRPTARELLARRLERGWQPTVSRLRAGEQVLGYAACVFDDPGLQVRTRSPQADA